MKKLEKILWSGVYSNDPKKVAFALNLGADVNIKNAEGWTPLHWSTCWDYVKIAEILILQANSDIHIINKSNCTPLHFASTNNRLEIARMLIEAGADVEAKRDDEKIPLALAKSEEMKTLLIEHGATL